MKKIFLPLIFIGVSFLYVFSRQPAAALAGLAAANTSRASDIAAKEQELLARLRVLQERAAKLESAAAAAALAPPKKVAAAPVKKPVPAAPPSVQTPAPVLVPPVSEEHLNVPETSAAGRSTPAAGRPTPAAERPAPVPTSPPPPPPPAAPEPVPEPPPPTPVPAPPVSEEQLTVPAIPAAERPAPSGTYVGNVVQAGSRGPVQVQATLASGVLTDVAFLSYPNAASASVAINNQAMPVLIQEAIAAQSANVATVSGATLTSNAFKQSLASALAQA